jgi:hypothetical protein
MNERSSLNLSRGVTPKGLFRNRYLMAILGGLIIAIFTLVIAYSGGVRGVNFYITLGLTVFIIIGGTILWHSNSSTDESSDYSAIQMPSGYVSQKSGRQQTHQKDIQTPGFDPPIDQNSMIIAGMQLLDQNEGGGAGSNLHLVLTANQEVRLRKYMLDRGLAYVYETRDGQFWWRLNAAGRSIVRKYLSDLAKPDNNSLM